MLNQFEELLRFFLSKDAPKFFLSLLFLKIAGIRIEFADYNDFYVLNLAELKAQARS